MVSRLRTIMNSPLGQTFGRLLIVGIAARHRSPSGRTATRWIGLCDCGELTVALRSNILSGRTTSCNKHGHGIPLQERPSYQQMHARIRYWRGKASQFMCVDCGLTAAHWSYDHKDYAQVWGYACNWRKREIAYSLDPDHYEPRCASCHQNFDRAVSR